MLSGKVLEIYNKHADALEKKGLCDFHIGCGCAHIVWDDGNYTHESINWCLRESMYFDNAEIYEWLEMEAEDVISEIKKQCTIDEIARRSLFDLLELSEDELYEGFKTHFTSLEKCHASS